MASTLLLAVGVLAWAISVRAAAPVLLRDPYLTDVSGSWAIVNLATDTSSPVPVISWGPAGGDCASPPNSVAATFVTSFGTGDQQFKASLSGLLPDTRYCYRVAQAGVDLLGSAPVFTSALSAGDATPFSFAVIADWGAGTTDESNVLSQVAAAHPSLILTAGDNEQTDGSQAAYGDLRGGHVFAPQYWPKVGRTIPAFPAMGNHGFITNLPYLQNWPQDGTVGACAATGCRYQQDTYCCTAVQGSGSSTYASAWYAFDWGNSRFYVLEGAWDNSYAGDFQGHFNGPVSGCPVCGTELTALTDDLAAHPSAHKFAFFHYPLYDDGSAHTSDTYLQGPNRLEGVLATYGVNVVFNGHDHIYERNFPQIPGSPMVSYLTGGGGASLSSVARQSAFDAFAQAVHEYLLVTVNGASVTVTPVDETGSTFDVQTYNFGGPPSDEFSINASPSSVSVAAGQSTTTTISTAVTSGSPQSISLSASGLPAGASASFNPASITSGGSSTLTLSTTAATPPGTSTVTVTGTGTSATHSTTVRLDVSGPPPPDDFSISASPDSLSVPSGQGATSTISTTLTSGSAQAITLSASGLPSGASAAFNPVSVNSGGSSVLTLSTTATTPPGTSTVTVTGTGVSATHSTAVTLTVTGTTGGGPQLVQATSAGETAKATALTATFPVPTGAGHLLVLTASVYTGATNTLRQVTDSAGNTWVKVGAYFTAGRNSDGELWYAANAAPATTVTATVKSAAVVAIQVQEFSGTATSNVLDVASGASNTGTRATCGPVTPIAANDLAVGFIAGHSVNQAITVTAAGFTALPQQTSTNGTATPASVVSAYRALSGAPAQSFTGTFPTAMYWACGIALFRTGSPPPASDFSITASPNSVSVTAGQSATSTISTTVTSGSPQSVSLSASGLPAGASASFNPASITSGGSSTLTLSTSAATPPGSSTVTVTGTGASATHTTTVRLDVTGPPPPNDFSITASPNSVSVTAGQSVTSTISTTVTSGSPQSVSLSASGLPAGASASFNPASITSGGSSTLTLSTSAATPPGSSTVTVTGTGASATHSTTVTLGVTGTGGGGARLVQATSAGETASSTSLSATFAAATGQGDLLVLTASVYTGATNTIRQVTDSAGNAWVKVGAYFSSGHYSDGELWYSANAKPATSVTVTVGTAAVVAIQVQEFSGMATSNVLDVASGASNTGTQATCGPVTASATNDLAVGFIAGHTVNQAMTVTAAGFTALQQQTSTNGTATPASVVSAYRVLSGAPAQSFTGTFPSAMYWAAGIALFRTA